jgi:2-polyprenyl-3-methyl-5-hydroxy-6-metoxy-1,4-benzoquinol methylase
MIRVAQRPCPICNHIQVEILHKQRFLLPDNHPLSNGYDVVICDMCGFVYADTNVTQPDYDRFYAEHSKYEDAKTGTGGIENPYDWKRQQETARQIASFLQNPNASILDVGCANGGILKALKDIGHVKLCGIDPSPACIANTRALGIEAYVGSLFQPFKEHTFDCVILSHTLEHVHDIQSALLWITDRLKPNGVVYVEVPDAARYVDFIYAPLQDFNAEHINHFSLTCLENLMAHSGFTCVDRGTKALETGPHIFYPAIYGFWKQQAKSPTALRKDDALRDSIQRYVQRSQEILKDIELHLQQTLINSRQVIVWGAGQLAMKLLIETSLARAEILAFVDNNSINQGKVLRGVPIIAPNQLDEPNAPIVIATMLHHHAILDQIRQLGLTNEIILLTEE